MKVKYGNDRVVMDNVASYTIGMNKGRYSIFFYYVGGGYKELVSFDKKKDAELVCSIIDLYDIEFCAFIDGKDYIVVDKDGNYVDDVDSVKNPEYIYISCSNPVCDIAKIMNELGMEAY